MAYDRSRPIEAKLDTVGFHLPYSFADLVRCLRKLDGGGLELLVGIANFASEIGPLDTHGKPPISSISLASVMAAVLAAYPSMPRYNSTTQLRPLDRSFVVNLCHRAFSIDDEDLRESAGVWELLRLSIRVQGLQSLLQADTTHEVGRAAVLVGTTSVPAIGIWDSQEANCLIREHFGVEGDAYFAAFFGLWTQVVSRPVLDVPQFIRHFRQGSNAERAIWAVLDRHSITTTEASRRLCSSDLAKLQGTARAFELFSQFPFIRISPTDIVAAPHPFVRLASRSSLFFGARRASRSRGQMQFHQAIGERMANYAIGLLRAAMPTARAWDTHGDSVHEGMPDAVFADDLGDWALLVEVKGRMPPASVLVGADLAEFQKSFVSLYPAMLAQLIKAAFELHRRGSVELTKVVRRAKSVYLLGLMPAIPAGLQLPAFRSLIEREALSTLKPNVRDWFLQERARGHLSVWHLDGIGAIEDFVSRADGECLIDVLNDWLVNQEALVRADESAVGIPPTFSDYLRHLWTERPGRPFSVIEDIYMQFMDRVKAIYADALGIPMRSQ